MAAHPEYVELHARSAFSFLQGASHPEALVHQASELGMDALALTDRDGVYGSARAHYAAKKLNGAGASFRAIVGAELTLGDGLVLPVLVQNRTGYQNLCRLLTRAKLRAAKNESRIAWSEFEGSSEGLIALTGDEQGPIRHALARHDPKLADRYLRQLTRLFGKQNLYVELQRHLVRGETAANRLLGDLAQAHRLPLLASNGVTCAHRHDRCVHDAFTCLRQHTHLDEAGTLLSPNAERHLKSPRQMQSLFADLPEAITNTLRLAERLEFTLENLGYQFPKYPVPENHNQASFLREQTYLGARERYGRISPPVRHQLDHELKLIEKLGFDGYFLIVWDIVNFARDSGILVQGRGSAANSAVCYCLGITAVDAIKQKLLFERFLSEGRDTWPDIDLDLPSGQRRESVIQEVYRRFAPHGAAMTANVITYRGRSAMREMGKVLNLPEDMLGRFSKLFGGGRPGNRDELKQRIRLAGLADKHPRLPALLHLYENVYGLPRHLGQHSGGMIIADRGLDRIVPLEPAAMPGRTVVQWDKDDCADLGIIKVDLLGLGMLAAMQDTLALCEKRLRPVDLATLPKDDPPTYDLMCAADTIGLFQIESRAQMATLPRMKPRVFYDLAIEVAIIRPGPIAGGLVHPYLNRRNGQEAIDYIDERFRPALERTLGVPLFQEQVLQMAMIAADFTGSQAEELRRAISFHRSEERMLEVLAKLRAAMDRKQVPLETQDKIVNSIQSFALYGFPESHAISFALIAYASAWLKTHRCVEFYTGLLNNQPMGFYSRATLVNDAKKHGLRIRPVNVLHSDLPCTVESNTELRLGLNQVKHLSRSTAKRISSEQQKKPFSSLDDFLLRSKPRQNERRALAKIGAFNGLPGITHRREALWNAEPPPLDPGDLFAPPKLKSPLPALNLLPFMTPVERLQADYSGLDLSTGPHPMAYIRHQLPPGEFWRTVDLIHGRPEQAVTIAGLVICRQRPSTAKGHLFISLEDETGIANAFVHADIFKKHRLTITQEPFLKLHGRLQIQDQVASLYTLGVEALPFASMATPESHDFH